VTPKQQRFVSEYLANGLNATRAAISAGYSEKTAKSQGARLLTNVDIASAVGLKTEKALVKADLSVEKTLDFVARMAFFDVKDLFEDDGSLKLIKDMSPEARTVIAGLEVTELFDGETGEQKHAIGLLKKIKLSDRRGALDMLMRYHALYHDKLAHTGPDGEGPVEAAITVKFVKPGQNDLSND